MLTDEKFAERAESFALLKNVDGKYFTFEEYKTLIEPNQKDKDGNLVYLYATDKEAQHAYIEAAKSKGYDVLMMDGMLDSHFISRLEQKSEGKVRYARVDADVIDKLIMKEDAKKVDLPNEAQNALIDMFNSQLPNDSKKSFVITFENLSADNLPVYIMQNEFMRRMKEMSATQSGMNFYGDMPDSYNFVVNAAHPLIARLLKDEESACGDKVNPLVAKLDELSKKRADLMGDKKESDLPDPVKEEVKKLDDETKKVRDEKKDVYAKYASESKSLRQLVDLALLSNNLLKGEALSAFIKRSVDMM